MRAQRLAWLLTTSMAASSPENLHMHASIAGYTDSVELLAFRALPAGRGLDLVMRRQFSRSPAVL